MQLSQELPPHIVLKDVLFCSGFNYVRRFVQYNMFSIYFICHTKLFTFSSFLLAGWLVATLSNLGRNSLILRDDEQIVFLLPVLCKTSLFQDGGCQVYKLYDSVFFYWTQLFLVFLTSTFSKTFGCFFKNTNNNQETLVDSRYNF